MEETERARLPIACVGDKKSAQPVLPQVGVSIQSGAAIDQHRVADVGLMSLPGELRNQIYEHALACTNSMDGSSPRVTDQIDDSLEKCPAGTVVPARRSKKRSANISESDVCDCGSEFLGLMHVCRQIRTEFRPRYMLHPVRVDYNDAFEYLETFYPMNSGFVRERQPLPGNIQIDMHIVSDTNIVPLLQHLFRFPQLEFTFGRRFIEGACERGLWSALDAMFRNHAEAWKKHLGTDIGRVSWFGWHGPQFSVRDVEHLEVHFKTHVPGIWNFSKSSPGPLHPILEELALRELGQYFVRIYLGY